MFDRAKIPRQIDTGSRDLLLAPTPTYRHPAWFAPVTNKGTAVAPQTPNITGPTEDARRGCEHTANRPYCDGASNALDQPAYCTSRPPALR